MKLLYAAIENFGTLHNLHVDFEEGINCIYESNGWGKSTLCVFIRVMFYGFEGEKSRNDIQNERKHYKPWQGGIYGGSIDFEYQDSVYILTRSFGSKNTEDEVSLRDAQTNLETSLDGVLGEKIFGVNAESFRNTIFISQNDISAAVTDEITGKIGNISSAEKDIDNYENAIASLNKSINSLNPNRKTGEIYKLNEQITEYKFQIQKYTQGDDLLKNLLQRQKSLEQEMNQLKIKRENLMKKAKRASELYVSDEEIQEYNELEEVFSNHDIDESFVDKLIEQNRKSGKMYSFFEFVIAILVFAGLCVILPKYRFYFAGAFAVSVILILIKYKVNSLSGKKIEDFLDLFYEIPESLSHRERKALLSEIKEDYERYQYLAELVHTQVHFDFGELDELEQRIRICSQEQSRAGFDYKKEISRKEQIAAKTKEIQALQLQAEKLTKQYEIYIKTRDFLIQARNNFTSRYMDVLLEKFNKYYAMLDVEHYEFTLDSDFCLYLNHHNHLKDIEFLSRGYSELAAICYRMAMIECVYRKEKPFLVFDDCFSNFDTDKLKKAREFLNRMEHEYQILYFTCHESRII